MRFLFVFGLVSLIGLSPAAVFAQNYTATVGRENTETKTLNKDNNYTAIEDLGEKEPEKTAPKEETSDTEENVTPMECTAEHRQKLAEYDKILVSYYEESADISKNFSDYDNSVQMSDAQAKINAYSDFIASQEYKDSILLRQLCDTPAPPRPYYWPEWLPVPDPMDVGNGPITPETAALSETIE